MKALLVALATAASATTVVVSPTSMNGWILSFGQEGAACGAVTSTAGFASGPDTPPLPTGSLQLDTGANGLSRAFAAGGDYAGLLVTALTSVRYSSYVRARGNSPALDVSLQIPVSTTGGTVADFSLIFEPVYQTTAGCMGAAGCTQQWPRPADATWVTWNVIGGVFWLSNDVNLFRPLSYFTNLYPMMRLANRAAPQHPGSFRLYIGCAATDSFMSTNADALIVTATGRGTTTFNFELVGPPVAAPPTCTFECQVIGGLASGHCHGGTAEVTGVASSGVCTNGAVTASVTECNATTANTTTGVVVCVVPAASAGVGQDGGAGALVGLFASLALVSDSANPPAAFASLVAALRTAGYSVFTSSTCGTCVMTFLSAGAVTACTRCNVLGNTTTTRQQQVSNSVQLVVCPSTNQTACFQAAACAGVVFSPAACTASNLTACPTCPVAKSSSSKKGLLGLLGLLAIIPLVLLLLCCLLLCCFLSRRRKNTTEYVPSVVPFTVACEPAVMHTSSVYGCSPGVAYDPHCGSVGPCVM